MYMESGGHSVMVVVCFYLAFSTHPLPHKTQTVHGAGFVWVVSVLAECPPWKGFWLLSLCNEHCPLPPSVLLSPTLGRKAALGILLHSWSAGGWGLWTSLSRPGDDTRSLL